MAQGALITGGRQADSIFVQDEAFIGYSHVQGLYPLTEKNYNALELLYVASVMRKIAVQKKFDYANKFNRKFASEFMVMLPVLTEKSINYKFMETYIKAIEKLVIKDVVDWKNKVIETTKEVVNN